MNRFEQLIEYVINDEEAKAQELFHDIVVEKSRQIYENIMADEELAEDDDLDEGMMDEVDAEEQSNMSLEGEEPMGGDDADDFIDDVEASDDNDADDGDAADNDFGGDMDGDSEPATKDDIMNLEDKLDQLMAEFESAMGGDDMGDGDDFGPEEGGDAIEMDDTDEMTPGMMEAISLKAAPKPVTAEQGNGKAGPVAFNSGATGMASKPVRTGTSQGGQHDTAAYRNATKDLIGKVGNTPAQSTQDLRPANKPHLGQAAGVNNKSPLPSGRKG